jgi:hypothetical protein
VLDTAGDGTAPQELEAIVHGLDDGLYAVYRCGYTFGFDLDGSTRSSDGVPGPAARRVRGGREAGRGGTGRRPVIWSFVQLWRGTQVGRVPRATTPVVDERPGARQPGLSFAPPGAARIRC